MATDYAKMFLEGTMPEIATEPKSDAVDDAATKEKEQVSTAEDVARATGSGVAAGVVGLPGVFGDIEMLSRMGLEKLGADVSLDPFLPTSQEVISAADPYLGGALSYDPQTSAGRIARTGAEFAGGAVLPVGGVAGGLAKTAARTAKTSALPMAGVGLAAGGAEEALDSGLAGTAVAVPLSIGVGALQARRGRLSKELGRTMKGVSAADMQAAKQLEEAGKAAGIKLTGAEAIGAEPLLGMVEGAMRQPKAASLLQPVLEARTEALPQAVSRALDEFGEGVIQPGNVAPQAAQTAEKILGSARKTRRQAADPFYEAAKTEKLSKESTDSLSSIIDDAVAQRRQVGANTPTGKKLTDFINRISSSTKAPKEQVGRKITGPATVKPRRKPITEVGKLHSAFKQFRDDLIAPPEAKRHVQKEARGYIGKLNNRLEKIVKTSDNIKAGNAIHEKFTNELVNDLKQTGLEAISKAKTNANAVASQISDPAKASARSITKIADEMNKVDKEAFPTIANYWLRNAADKALGKADTASGAKFSDMLRGTAKSKENLNAVLTGLSKARDKNPQQVVKGFNELLDVLEATGRTTSLLGPSKAFVEPTRRAGLVSGFDIAAPIRGIGQKLAEMRSASFYEQFAKALVSDNSVAALEELGRAGLTPQRRQALVNSIIVAGREASQSQSGLLAEQ
jgi:hypothetical protein